MTGSEFIEKLKKALENDLSEAQVREQTAFYSSYIREEVRKGRSEEEVTGELGDPWAIARNIISGMEFQNESGGYQYETEQSRQRSRYQDRDLKRQGNGHIHTFGFKGWWQLILLLLGIIGILVLVVAVIGGIFSLLAPVLVPVILIVIILRFFGRRQ